MKLLRLLTCLCATFPAWGGALPLTWKVGSNQMTLARPCSISLPLRGPGTGDLRLVSAEWLQVVSQAADDPDTRLAGGKDTLLNLTFTSSTPAPPPRVSLWVASASGRCQRLEQTAGSARPATEHSVRLTLPGSLMTPGTRFIAQGNASDRRTAAAHRRLGWSDAPVILPAQTETLALIPLALNGIGRGNLPGEPLDRLLLRLYPLARIVTRSESPLTLTAPDSMDLAGLRALLRQVERHCKTLNGRWVPARTAIKCIGLLPPQARFRGSWGEPLNGLAFIGGISLVATSPTQLDDWAVSKPDAPASWLTPAGRTLAHEFGHLMNLGHGNCGGAQGIDSRLSADGLIGDVTGWDSLRQFVFEGEPAQGDSIADLMSYCPKAWMSRAGYRAALNYRAGFAAARIRGPAPVWLTLTRQADGSWRTEPGPVPAHLVSTRWQASTTTGDHWPVFAATTGHGDLAPGEPWFVQADREPQGPVQLTPATPAETP